MSEQLQSEQFGAIAQVSTPTPDRYAKQLGSHLGRRSTVTEDAEGTRITLPDGMGSCLLEAEGDTLTMTATAPSAELLERVTTVVGSHLERFGQRNELEVSWRPAT